MKPERTKKRLTPGKEIAASLREAIAWAKGENVPVKVTRTRTAPRKLS